MKKIILLFFIGYTALHAQIATRYALPPTNGTLQKMEYSSWGRAYIDKNGLPDITNPADERVLITYKDGKPHLVQSFRVRQSETIPYMQVEFLYKGAEIASVKEYNNTGFPNKNEFKVTKTSIPLYEKGVMVSEIILDKNDKQVGFVKYELTNLPLIIGDSYTVNNSDTVKTGRSGIQFDGQIHQTQFEINGSDTLYAMTKIRDTKDGYISYFMAKGMSGEKHRLTYQVQIKKDHQKNIVSMVTREAASPAKTKGAVTTYRYQYKGDPEWPSLEVASVFPEAILSPRAWGNDQKNILLVFSKGKSQHEGIWISKTFQPIPDQNQYKGTFFEQIYELQKAKKGDWKYLPASQQIELLQNGQRIALFRMELTGKNSLKLQSDGYYDFLKLTRFDVTEEKPVEVKNDKPAEIEAMDDALVEVEAPPAPVEDPNEVHTVVENPPFFPGGESAMMQYITMNLKYPQIAKENGIEGKVFVSFIVEKEGSLTDLKVARDIGGGCGAAAMNMVRSMPKWKPGQHRGETVRVKYVLPVRFTLSK